MSDNQQGNINEGSLSLKEKYHLDLKPSSKEGVLIGVKKSGVNYSVRENRKRYFFPEEWIKFIKLIKNKQHRLFFITALNSGGRIMEILNLRYKDIDVERGTISFPITKQRKAKRDFNATKGARTFFISSNFISEYKSFIRGKIINSEHYIFLDNSKLPSNYYNLSNKERKKYYSSKIVSYSKMLKNKLKKAEIKDYYNFSPHNIRKTYGMWLRVYNKEIGEICYRMGDDVNTYMTHYGSSLIFTQEERKMIFDIMGDIK